MSYIRIIKAIRKDLKKCRKKHPNAQAVAYHDVVPLYNPAQQNYRAIGDKELQGWYIYICGYPDKIYKEHRIIIGMDKISLVMTAICFS